MKSGKDFDPIETREWIESLDDVIDDQGTDRASFLLNELAKHLMDKGAVPSYNLTTPFKNTISPENEAMMPGDLLMMSSVDILLLSLQQQCFMTLALIIFLEDKKAKMMI
jgi:pyruvate dehydrogenase E1 component